MKASVYVTQIVYDLLHGTSVLVTDHSPRTELHAELERRNIDVEIRPLPDNNEYTVKGYIYNMKRRKRNGTTKLQATK